MKKTISFLFMAVLIFACKTSSVTSTKLDRPSQVGIKGNWTLTSVTYPGSDFIKVQSFYIADSKCFEGSTWNFISNNNKGSMSLNKAGCEAFSSQITWFVNQEGQFILKILAAGEKAKLVREGYALRVANQTDTSFQLLDNINVGGQNKTITYQFQKNN